MFIVHAKLVGHGHRDITVAAEVCADGGQGSGRKEDGNVFPTGSTHCDDDGSANVLADAPRTGAGNQRPVLEPESLNLSTCSL